MAKGSGFYKAYFMSLISNSTEWEKAAFAAVGGHPDTCPVCGHTENWSKNIAAWCCRCYSRPTERAQIVLSAAREAGFNFDDVILTIRDGDGEVVAEYRKGKTNPVWYFRGRYALGVTTKKENFPSVEGFQLVLPDWWPTEKLAEYDENRAQKVEKLLAEVKTEAVQSGMRIGRNTQFQSESHCSVCGRTLCDGAKAPRYGQPEAECQRAHAHPETLLMWWTNEVKTFQRLTAEKAAKALATTQKRSAELQIFLNALNSQGYYMGDSMSGIELPEGAFYLSASRGGILVVAAKVTVAQFQEIAKAYDFSEVIDLGKGLLEVRTTNPGHWIGKGGSMIKTLTEVVGAKRINVVEVEKAPFKPKPKPSRLAGVTPSPPPIAPTAFKMFSSNPLKDLLERGTCACGGHLSLTEKISDVRYLRCDVCGKKLDYPKVFFTTVQVEPASGTNTEGRAFKFESDGVYTGTIRRRRAKAEELDLLEKVLNLMGLAGNFEKSLAEARKI